MIPVFLDPACVRVGLYGAGPLAARRMDWLLGRQCRPVVFVDPDDPQLGASDPAPARLGPPSAEDMAGLHILFVVGVPLARASVVAATARALNLLVNVEDVKPLCDVHSPAIVTRGRLLVAIGTGGASPAVASAVRERIDSALHANWGQVLEEISAERTQMQSHGASMDELAAAARARIARAGL